jgi:hypothetical protein
MKVYNRLPPIAPLLRVSLSGMGRADGQKSVLFLDRTER